MVNVWRRLMVFVLSFQMSFIAPNILSMKFTGAVKRVSLQQNDVVTPCYYKPSSKLLLHSAVTDLLVNYWYSCTIEWSCQHLLLIYPLAVTLQLWFYYDSCRSCLALYFWDNNLGVVLIVIFYFLVITLLGSGYHYMCSISISMRIIILSWLIYSLIF